MHGMELTRCPQLETCSLYRVLEATRHLVAPIVMEEILQRIIEAALQVLDAERGTVFLYDRAADELYSRVSTGEPENGDDVSGVRQHEIRFPAHAGIAGETARSRRLINVTDCYADPRFNREIDRRTGYVTRCMLSIPLLGIDEALVGVLQVLNKHEGVFNPDDEMIASALGSQCAVTLQRGMLLQEYMIKQKMEHDIAVAREIQLGALPRQTPQLPGYQLACWFKPADETGGDVYDAVAIDDHRVALLLGDATGHGIGAALSVSQLRSMFRMGLLLGADLGEIFARINQQLTEDLPTERFITGFLGVLDGSSHRIYYLSGGQAPLLHYHAARREVEWLEASTIPMGLMRRLPPVVSEPREMAAGDIFAVITDGFFEYQDRKDRQFGREGVEEVVLSHHDRPAEELIDALCRRVCDFSDGALQQDDMTIVLIKRTVQPARA